MNDMKEEPDPELLYVLLWEYHDDHVIVGVYDKMSLASSAREKILVYLKNGFLKDTVSDMSEDDVKYFIMKMLEIKTVQKNLTYFENVG